MNPWNARGEMRFYLLLLVTGEIRLAPGQFAANQALEIIKDRDFSLRQEQGRMYGTNLKPILERVMFNYDYERDISEMCVM